MALYKGVNYQIISEEVQKELEVVQESEKRGTRFGRINKFREYPKAARHHLSLFPNNYLDM